MEPGCGHVGSPDGASGHVVGFEDEHRPSTASPSTLAATSPFGPAPMTIASGVTTDGDVRLQRESWYEHDLDGAVALRLEHRVRRRCLGQRDVMRRERVDAERVVVDEQGQDVVDPAPHVGLAHPQLDLLVEHRHHRHRVGHAAVHADDGDGAAAPNESMAMWSAASRSTPAFASASRPPSSAATR